MPKPIANPPNPWQSTHVEYLGEPPPAKLEVYEEDARSILSENDSPDVGFRWSVNPYRGCFHACAYCYARPSHQYLGFGAGTDFDRRIVVKRNAPALLRKQMLTKSWTGETIVFSGNTDCYQPLEASYELTRRCLQVCHDFRNPVALITKGMLIRRDAELLGKLAREARCHVSISIPFADDATARLIEPFASPPSARFETLRILADAGVPTAVGVAPIIPGLNDSDVPEILERARDAGATSAFYTLVRLAAEVLPVFTERVRAAMPERAEKVLNAVRDVRGGKMNESRFGDRMHGRGPRWDIIEALFRTHVRRLGMERGEERHADPEAPTTFRRPGQQGSLF